MSGTSGNNGSYTSFSKTFNTHNCKFLKISPCFKEIKRTKRLVIRGLRPVGAGVQVRGNKEMGMEAKGYGGRVRNVGPLRHML
jgi:hypothetical protein